MDKLKTKEYVDPFKEVVTEQNIDFPKTIFLATLNYLRNIISIDSVIANH